MGFANNDEDEDTTAPANTTDANADSAEDTGPSPRLRLGQVPVNDDTEDSETPPASTGPSVADYIKQKYGLTGSGAKYADMMGDSTAAVKAARDEANHNKANIGIAQGLSQMFGGGTNDRLYNSLRNNEDQQAGLVADDRQQMLKNYLTGKGLMRQDTQDATAAADQAQKLKQFDVTNATNDATSPKAQALRDAYKKMFPGVVAQIGDNFNQLSENDLNTYFAKPLEMKQAADARAAQAAQMAQYHQDMIDSRNTIAANKLAAAPDPADKEHAAQGKAYTEMTNRVIGGRGAPQNVTKAQTAQMNIANANQLLGQYPDLSKMPPEQVKLLNAEIDKVATGGAPTEAGQAGLDPNTFAERWNKFKGQLSNSPTGADLAPFIQQNQEYLAGLNKVAGDVVTKYQRQTYDGYKQSGRLGSDLTDTFEAAHPELFPEKQKPAAAPASSPAPAPAATAPAAAPKRTVSAQELGDYATKHNMDPAAAKDWLTKQGYQVGN